MGPVQDRMETLIKKGFAADVVDGDVFDLAYMPGKGTSLIKNQKTLVTVKGLDFKRLFLAFGYVMILRMNR